MIKQKIKKILKNILLAINPLYKKLNNNQEQINILIKELDKIHEYIEITNKNEIISNKLENEFIYKNINEQNENIPIIPDIISPNDEMFTGNLEHYFNVSKSAMECINIAISMAKKFNSNLNIKSILDLPCGHGRVLRSLRAYFPLAKITACDLNRDGVDFCTNAFNAEGIYSDTDISKIKISKKYDLIWCGSLLTHLEAEKSKLFLEYFINKLDTMGLLIITFHGRFSRAVQKGKYKYIEDEEFEKILHSYNKKGYADYKNNKEYGISMLKPSWLFSYIEEKEDVTVIYYSERSWDNHQDVLALMKKSIC